MKEIDTDELLFRIFSRAYQFGRRWDEGLWRYHELGAVRCLLAEQPSLRDGPILDLGCGDGEVFGWIFGHRSDASGADSGATRNDDLRRARLGGSYSDVRQDDASNLSFADEQFTLVFSNSVLEHIAPIEPVLEEVERVLRPGGRFLFTTPDPQLYSRDVYQWRRVLGRLGLDWMGRRLVHRENVAYHHVSVLDFNSWRLLLEAAGFEDVELRSYLPLPVARVMTAFSGATRHPLLRRYAWRSSTVSRALSSPATEKDWIQACSLVLPPLLKRAPGPNQCGQLVLAKKAREIPSSIS